MTRLRLHWWRWCATGAWRRFDLFPNEVTQRQAQALQRRYNAVDRKQRERRP